MKNIQKKVTFLKKNLKKKYSKTDLDFGFPSFCQKIKETLTGSFLISYGEYPPQVRCFDLENLSLKFERHLDSSIQNFQIISQDWQKLLFLRNDKQLEFHNKGGFHYKTKILANGVDLLFQSKNNIAYIPSTKNEIFKLDLKEGKFLNSMKNESLYTNTCSGKSLFENILAFGNSGGIIKFWDPRIFQKEIFKIEGFKFIKKLTGKRKITSIRFSETNEFECFIGFENGEVILFDTRSNFPLISKEMEEPLPIMSIRMDQSGKKILIANCNQIKIWEKKSGKTTSFLDSKIKINHLCKIKNSGFFFFWLCKNPKLKENLLKKWEICLLGFPISNFFLKLLNQNKKQKHVRN
mmetsp:Transcript_13656/g.34340  ORF Transcript_13656/g.34340 Transcript_13656/m.34340 type:complete len:351 (+) Transcript_13656:95-1147(+)